MSLLSRNVLFSNIEPENSMDAMNKTSSLKLFITVIRTSYLNNRFDIRQKILELVWVTRFCVVVLHLIDQ